MEPVEQLVLAHEDGTPAGVAPKLETHHHDTPLHFAFSCYVFDAENRLLVTQRALHKKTWPGIWSNSCCGHPAPEEVTSDAVLRRLHQELGINALDSLELILPDFRYRAELDGIVENEICPVYAARFTGEVSPNPEEVADYYWLPWTEYVQLALAPDSTLSPWTQLQVQELHSHPALNQFLSLAT